MSYTNAHITLKVANMLMYNLLCWLPHLVVQGFGWKFLFQRYEFYFHDAGQVTSPFQIKLAFYHHSGRGVLAADWHSKISISDLLRQFTDIPRSFMGAVLRRLMVISLQTGCESRNSL